MYEQVEKPKENKSRAVANSVGLKKSNGRQGFGFVDNRPESIAQRKMQTLADNSISQPIQKKENKTGSFESLRSVQLNTINNFPMDEIDVVQRVIATIGYDPTQVNNDNPVVADQHASVQRSLALLKMWHGGESSSDINSLTDIGDQAQPLNILGHGSPDSIQNMSADVLAGKILRLKNKDKINAINLYSCSTHSKADGFAAQLKTILKEAGMDIPVKAPAGLLRIGQAASEDLGTDTYPPELRQKLDVAKDKMLATLEAFKQEKIAKMQHLKDEHARWSKFVDDRISEVMKDKKMSLKKKQEIVSIQTKNLIDEGQKSTNTINEIDRKRKKIEKSSQEKYLSDRDKAVSDTQPIQGDALSEVNAIVESANLELLKQKAQEILSLIEFENTAFEDLEWGEFQGSEPKIQEKEEQEHQTDLDRMGADFQ